MEAVVFFILKAAASGTIGHYLKRSLEAIDSRLRTMIENKESPATIAKYIEDRDLGANVNELANSILDSSIFIPMAKVEERTLDVRVDFFRQFLEIGFHLSREWKLDILLPGSLLGTNSLTLFLGKEAGDSKIVRSGIKLQVPKGNYEAIAIVPFKNSKDVARIWEDYKRGFGRAKSNSDEYAQIGSLVPELHNADVLRNPTTIFRVETITAGGIFYGAPSLAKELAGSALTLEGESAPIIAWQGGVAQMLNGIQDLYTLLFIPDPESEVIKRISGQLKSIIENVA